VGTGNRGASSGTLARAVLVVVAVLSAASADGQESAAYETMGAGAAYQYADDALAAGRQLEAMDAYRYVADSFPGSAEAPMALYRLANLMANHDKEREALTVYARLTAAYPAHWTVTSGGVAAYAALYLTNLHDYRGAIDGTVASLRRFDPNTNSQAWALAITRAAQALASLREYEQARRLLDERLPLCPWLLARPEYFEALYGIQVATGDLAGALSTAKAAYVLCPFAEAPFTDAVDMVRRAYIAQANVAAAEAFVRSQSDATAPNPLAAVALPAVSGQARDQLAASVKCDDVLALDLLLYTGDNAEALRQASLRLGAASADKAMDAILDVARVLKAADLNPARANQLIEFARTGKGANTLTGAPR